ncbi:MAG: universal stress protein [Haloarculaceae archaeon]
MYDTIVIPTDGSEHAVRAAEHGRYLADVFDAAVHVLNVVDVQSAGGLFDAGGVDEEFVTRLEAKGEHAVAAVEDVFDGWEALTTAVRRGKPAETILDYATEVDADVLTMGTHGRTGLDHVVTGSVTERVLRHADVPVLTVRATERNRVDAYEEVLVPTDGSDAAAAAVAHAIAIARETGARVHAVTVVDVESVAIGPDYASPGTLIESLKMAGTEATDDVAERVRAAGLSATTAVQQGFPTQELLAYAEANDVDLIAMGTHGRTGLGRVLLGSTTERIVRRADVPVLAVHGEVGERDE